MPPNVIGFRTIYNSC